MRCWRRRPAVVRNQAGRDGGAVPGRSGARTTTRASSTSSAAARVTFGGEGEGARLAVHNSTVAGAQGVGFGNPAMEDDVGRIRTLTATRQGPA